MRLNHMIMTGKSPYCWQTYNFLLTRFFAFNTISRIIIPKKHTHAYKRTHTHIKQYIRLFYHNVLVSSGQSSWTELFFFTGNIPGFHVSNWSPAIPVADMAWKPNVVQSGMGVTKAPFVNFSVSKVLNLSKVPHKLFESHLYLTGATAAELRRHLSNINVIFNR